MPDERNRYIRQALALSRRLATLAEEGEENAADDGCAVLHGVIRDCAYRIRGRAERERDTHRIQGLWQDR